VQLSKRTEILKSDRSSESSPISIKAMKEVWCWSHSDLKPHQDAVSLSDARQSFKP
jgi:hypothetical protein